MPFLPRYLILLNILPLISSFRAAVGRWNDFVAVGCKTESSQNRLSYCIVGQFLVAMIPHLSSTANGGFTLSHPDLHLGNIFVDDDLNITCIIDWASTSLGPITEFLATPELEGSISPPPRSQVAAFRSLFDSGATMVNQDDWKKAERIWYFSRLVRLLSKQDYSLFKALYELVYKIEEDGLSDPVDYAKLFHERARGRVTSSFSPSYTRRIHQRKR